MKREKYYYWFIENIFIVNLGFILINVGHYDPHQELPCLINSTGNAVGAMPAHAFINTLVYFYWLQTAVQLKKHCGSEYLKGKK